MVSRPRRVPFTVFPEVSRQRRRAFLYLASFAGVIVLYTVAYMWGMETYEGVHRTALEAFGIVIETFTTTGFGVDASKWTTPQMHLLMAAMQISGVLLIFMALPVFVAPWVQEALRVSPPTAIDDVEDHVVICGYSPRAETLIDEFQSWDKQYVIIVRNRDEALDLYEQGISVVHGDPESADALRNVHVEDAYAVVADAT
ncbi:potassium channel family protein, partial [Haladaptatus sp.]|uniref:potassium channel family protein n=1 Tax=Haladaptatus sp. TaxID=1973141 RepID=UPI003C5A172F